jgi:hypothetical protein
MGQCYCRIMPENQGKPAVFGKRKVHGGTLRMGMRWNYNQTTAYCKYQTSVTEMKAISLSHDDEYPPFLGGIQFSSSNADD